MLSFNALLELFILTSVTALPAEARPLAVTRVGPLVRVRASSTPTDVGVVAVPGYRRALARNASSRNGGFQPHVRI